MSRWALRAQPLRSPAHGIENVPQTFGGIFVNGSEGHCIRRPLVLYFVLQPGVSAPSRRHSPEFLAAQQTQMVGCSKSGGASDSTHDRKAHLLSPSLGLRQRLALTPVRLISIRHVALRNRLSALASVQH